MRSQKTYTAITATVLLALGVVGFAFYDQFHIPALVLFVDLVLGFWGLYVLLAK